MEFRLEEEILSTNDWGIFRILNEKLIDEIRLCVSGLDGEEDISPSMSRIREILSNLITIFKLGEEDNSLKENLREIYLFINKLAIKGYISRDREKFIDGEKILLPIYEAFKEKEMSERVNIVSGLTYGEKDLYKHGDNSKLNIEG